MLELSKRHMFSFYYDFLASRYAKTGLRLLCTDTDSLYLQLFNRPDIYRDILKFEQYFDRSGYPKHHFLHSDERRRHLGLFKDVHASGHISTVVALRSKM